MASATASQDQDSKLHQRSLLAAAMKRTDGKPLRGLPCTISFVSAYGHRVYLSGAYLITQCSERAYVLGDTQARQWVRRYSLILVDAVIHIQHPSLPKPGSAPR